MKTKNEQTQLKWNTMVPELSVKNFDMSLKFYTEVLGFSIRFQRTEPNFAYLDKENVQIMLEEIHDSAWITGELLNPLGRGINLQMEFANITDLYSKLKQKQFQFYRELNESWYQGDDQKFGQKEFLVQDPDGYLLRFVEVLE